MWLVLTRIRSGKSIAPSHIFQTSQVWNKTDTTKKHSIYPLPPKRCRSEREKREDLFSSVLLRLKKYLLPGNVKFNNLSITQSLKLRISMEKSFQFLSSQISYQILWAVMGKVHRISKCLSSSFRALIFLFPSYEVFKNRREQFLHLWWYNTRGNALKN